MPNKALMLWLGALYDWQSAHDMELETMALRVRYLADSALTCIFLAAISTAFILNTEFGSIDVKTVSIPDGDLRISGLLYHPREASGEGSLPAVVLVHGLSNAKQTMSGIALELAKRGFIALAMDAVGHGDSEGRLGGGNDATLGTLAAVRYLESQAAVNASSICLVGHSMGAGAIRSTAAAHGNILASVFIGGGLGGMFNDTSYDPLNATFPRNFLIAVGRYDVLFDLDKLKKESLLPVFGTSDEVVSGVLYGSFALHTARKLVTPATTHLFEPIDPTVVSETISWLIKAASPGSSYQNMLQEKGMSYLYRDGAIAVSFFALISLVLSVSLSIMDLLSFTSEEKKTEPDSGVVGDWKILVTWGGLALALYLPMSFVGAMTNFPPLVFGASIAWWMLATAISGLLVILFVVPRFANARLNLKPLIRESFDKRGVAVAVFMFALLCLIAGIVETVLAVDLGIVVPILGTLKSVNRILMFVLFLPFLVVYFFVDGIYLHKLRRALPGDSGPRSAFVDLVKAISIKVGPYVIALCLQYVPTVLLNVQLFPSFIGFLMEFFWMIIPIFVISTACSWWLYRHTRTLGMGIVFNSLLFAWIAAGLFPF